MSKPPIYCEYCGSTLEFKPTGHIRFDKYTGEALNTSTAGVYRCPFQQSVSTNKHTYEAYEPNDMTYDGPYGLGYKDDR